MTNPPSPTKVIWSNTTSPIQRERVRRVLAGIAVVACGFAAGVPAYARVALSAGLQPALCPSAPQYVTRANPWAKARRTLAPAGATAMRLCRYNGANGSRSLKLRRSRLVTESTTIAKVAGEFNALPRLPSGAAFSCPVDVGSQILVLFVYPNRQRVTIAVDLTGCQEVTNGDIKAIADGYGKRLVGARLSADLKRLTS
jgi:hypothetical protein